MFNFAMSSPPPPSIFYHENLTIFYIVFKIIEKFFAGVDDFSNFVWPTAVSIFAIGGMIGALLGPHVAKRFGR